MPDEHPVEIPASPGDSVRRDYEVRRQLALQTYGLLDEDHPSRADIRSLVTLAAAASGVPMAVINLLTENEQHQIEAVGFTGGVSARSDSMCTVVIDELEPLVLADARDDDRFRDNIWVAGPAAVRFYATFQLRTPAKVAIGSLCLFDSAPRTLLAEHQAMLALLAARVGDVLELELQSRRWRATAHELEAANKRLNEFAATVSHDLRGPLATVQFALDMLGDHPADEGGASGPGQDDAFSRRDLLARAQRSTVRMASTIGHLLDDFTASEADELRPVWWRQVAANAVEDLAHELAAINVALDVTDAQVRCRPVGLRLALQNLLSNAAKYAGPLDARVELQWTQRDGYGEIAVIDHGPGVPPADRDRIFDSGQRGRTTPEDREAPEALPDSGVGLGLATSRRLVEEMGGRLTLRQTPGGGATFVIILPDD